MELEQRQAMLQLHLSDRQRRQAMLQLHLSNRQCYYPLKCVLYQGLGCTWHNFVGYGKSICWKQFMFYSDHIFHICYHHGTRHTFSGMLVDSVASISWSISTHDVTIFMDWFHAQFLWNWSQENVTHRSWLYVNIDSGYDLEPSSNKPLPEPMLT